MFINVTLNSYYNALLFIQYCSVKYIQTIKNIILLKNHARDYIVWVREDGISCKYPLLVLSPDTNTHSSHCKKVCVRIP